MNMDKNLESIRAADNVEKAAEKQFFDEVNSYIAKGIARYSHRPAEIEKYLRDEVVLFIAKIQASPAVLISPVPELLFELKTYFNVAGQLRAALKTAGRKLTEDDKKLLLTNRRNWKAFVDCRILVGLNPGAVEKLAARKMGEIAKQIEGLANSAALAGKLTRPITTEIPRPKSEPIKVLSNFDAREE